jgi:uncharacterized LabA/DUF88 family protein
MPGMSISGGGPSPESFQKAMVFVDGTNLFYRLNAEKLRITKLVHLFPPFLNSRRIARIYLYTVEQHFAAAQAIHEEGFSEGIRLVFGEGVVKKDGNIKEKGVDALLVADMVYHAASKNCEYAMVVTADTDFVYVLSRVEDFGCRTAILSVCCDAPDRLRQACDDYYQVSTDYLIQNRIAVRA